MTTIRRTRQVALLIETSNAYARGLLRGIMAYVRSHGPWALRLGEHGRGEVDPHELDEFAGDGIIARIENPRVAALVKKAPCPVVDLSAARLVKELPWVETDDAAIARAAADHLLERGLQCFGYAGDNRFNWSRWRGAAFEKHLIGQGFACSFAPNNADRLTDWLVDLPKPAGIMACYDIRGREVLDAARRAALRVPDDLAVIGVDDDELLCELADPPLSSVIPDARGTGWLAARILDDCMEGRELQSLSNPVPPLGVTTRRSTDMLAVEDADIAAALRMIREKACEGLSVHDLVKGLPLSRRMFESRFQKYLGRSPHAEILRVKLERAKKLLAEPELTLDAVARRCGFGQGEYLSAVFKREYGQTPGSFRAARRKA